MASINNYNSTITNQVIGTQINNNQKQSINLDDLKEILEKLKVHIQESDTVNKKNALVLQQAIYDLSYEIKQAQPNHSKIEQLLAVFVNLGSLPTILENGLKKILSLSGI
ncbi:hypothetical protein [Parvibium lacunae]|uniref:Uncharacterized protein n=1 Tax=Parvibium lacunae TaxID=1888893 RepID=A0A368L6G3_9BURK|nr:hypothetical protein [Parvibium lacunae]RCS59243.1 hypothetical protein DU000_00370 [Parvibium lacunae]